MATLYKKRNSPNWFAQHFTAEGKRVSKSTRTAKKREAERVASTFEATEHGRRDGQDRLPSRYRKPHMPNGPSQNLNRRNMLRLGACGLSSLCLPGSPVDAAIRRGKGKAKRVLIIFEQGGMSQMDTWDPKPDAPSEHRSPFAPISTKVPGIQVSELLKKTAKHIEKLTIVRCMTQPTPGISDSHGLGSQYVYTGEAPGGPVQMADMSSVVAMLHGSEAPHLPANIMVPGTSAQGDQTRIGFLPPGYRVFKTGGEPADPAWKVPNLGLLGVDQSQFNKRANLLKSLDRGVPGGDTAKDALAMIAMREQAVDMLTNPATQRAFDLQSEKHSLRERYGLGHRGQCYLLGRKLIESGVRFVTVDAREPLSDKYPGGTNMNWDHHDLIYSTGSSTLKKDGPGAGRWGIGTWPMMGSTDQAFAALLEDMEDRGLLDETLVCFVTEFGRTPKLNARKGRDHWTHAFTFVFAGAGVPGGQVVGATDKQGGYITSSTAYTLEDYAATIYAKLGIDTSNPIHTPADRPIFLAKEGTPIPELF